MSKKILLVEDEVLIAIGEAHTLKKHGYEVVTANSGEKAIDAVDADSDISLILMDIDLGKGIDGPEAAERILKKTDIPVVFLSSHTEPEVVEKTERITSYGYIVKNSGETVLLASIRMAFRLHEAYRDRLEKNSRLTTLLDNAEDLIGRLDQDKTHLYVNQALCEAMGISGEEYVGKRIEDLGGAQELTQQWNDAVDRVFEAGESVRIEFRIPGTQGDCVLDCKIVPEIVEGGKVKTVVAISRDITERNRMENELRKKNAIFNEAEKIADIGSYVWNLQTDALEWSRNMYKIAGLDQQKFCGNLQETIKNMIHPEDRETVQKQIITMIEKKETQPMEFRLVRPNGEVRWLRSGSRFVFDKTGRPVRNIGVHQDITKQKQGDRAFSKREFRTVV